MTIKKPISTSAADSVSAPGGAVIADRFNLDLADPNAKKASGVGTTVAVVAGVLALAVAGVLTFVIYQHWQFLANA